MIPSLLQALGLVFVIEGLIYAVAPGAMRQMMATLPKLSNEQLRMSGAVAIAIGVAVVWLARTVG